MLLPPTDDELLLAFVDDCPHQAMSDYRRRLGSVIGRAAWDVDLLIIRDLFEREWENRSK